MAATPSASKRLVFCFDGTTNTLDTRHTTNVVKLAQSLSPMTRSGVAQLIYYDRGVGTDAGEKLRGGALGHGLDKNLYDAYAFLIFNYSPATRSTSLASRGAPTPPARLSALSITAACCAVATLGRSPNPSPSIASATR